MLGALLLSGGALAAVAASPRDHSPGFNNNCPGFWKVPAGVRAFDVSGMLSTMLCLAARS